MKDLLSIVSHFQMQGTVREIKPLGSGLINDTYKVTTVEADAPDYVLQRINHAIFQVNVAPTKSCHFTDTKPRSNHNSDNRIPMIIGMISF